MKTHVENKELGWYSSNGCLCSVIFGKSVFMEKGTHIGYGDHSEIIEFTCLFFCLFLLVLNAAFLLFCVQNRTK